MKDFNLKLIEGNFTSEESKTILLDLINYKINFHRVNRLSDVIRYGEEKDNYHSRIDELTNQKELFVKWLQQEGGAYKIVGNIKIERIND